MVVLDPVLVEIVFHFKDFYVVVVVVVVVVAKTFDDSIRFTIKKLCEMSWHFLSCLASSWVSPIRHHLFSRVGGYE